MPGDPLAELGRTLFFDTRLSEPAGQACATCHDPSRAFSDPRPTGAGGALSVGADGRSLGMRNAPTLTYVASVPPFHRQADVYVGGLFLDGRAPTLQAQALQPLLNPLEMALPDEQTLVRRVLADTAYREHLLALFGPEALAGDRRTVDAITTAIAAFERTEAFSTFDSRFDRALAGEYVMNRDEAIGQALFFSDLSNCSQCHLNEIGRLSPRETFTNHGYHNIGVPVNAAAWQANGVGADHRDLGLGGRSELPDAADQSGRFRVPTLRNVAVTAPYMHNGVFASLEAAVAFYGKYTLSNRPAQTNPETGEPWAPPETGENVDLTQLRAGQPLDAQRVRHLVAFLKTLTDARYEHLIVE
ncbi:MAG: cytochrome-c peroxidase [Pseudomonadales bacterium]